MWVLRQQHAILCAAGTVVGSVAQQDTRRSRSGPFNWYAAAAAGVGPSSSRGGQDTAVPTSTGGWREEYSVGRSGRHPLVECCFCSGQPHPARLPRGVVKSVEPSSAPPAGLTPTRPGLRAGRECNFWFRCEVGGLRPLEPPGRRRDRGPGSSAARSQRAKRAWRPDRKRGPQRG
ncbi:hypothetical protein NDU88_007308 [Pleurodeles waltl]|uniref:Secreted protein n=1 Tax=Pleurodeles waltl TaxID=8319 RepID=A0AAV7U029_PLEWA|nr:hypothetical protein NDU88_007308 [Pleurodeles waltl]